MVHYRFEGFKTYDIVKWSHNPNGSLHGSIQIYFKAFGHVISSTYFLVNCCHLNPLQQNEANKTLRKCYINPLKGCIRPKATLTRGGIK